MWSIFEALRERREDIDGDVESFEQSRANVENAMNITVAEGSQLVAKLRRADPVAESHILDLVNSIQQAKGQVNSQLATEQAHLEALSLRTQWEKEIEEECEKLQQWRVVNSESEGVKSEFGVKITQLTNFKMKEQAKCFDLARTGRELLITLTDENCENIHHCLEVRPSNLLFFMIIYIHNFNINI